MASSTSVKKNHAPNDKAEGVPGDSDAGALLSNSLADDVNIGVPTNDQIISLNTISGPSKPADLFKVDMLIGTAGNDVLRAPAGSFGSIMIGGAGADTLIGGVFGRDTASYSTATTGVTASFLNPSLNTGDAKGDTYTNMDDLIGSDFDDILTGDSNSNNLDGGLGNDLFMATAGGDLYVGEGGIDTVDYSLFGSGVNSNLGGSGGISFTDSYSGIENLTGSNFADTLTGDGGDNILRGGRGGDRLDGGAGRDTADYSTSASGVTITLDANGNASGASISGGDATGDVLISIENLTGSAFADSLTGGSGDNVLIGGAGADHLDGAGGNNTASYATSTGAVIADLADSSQNTGDALGDTYANIQNLTGGAGNDTLIGDANDNVLIGGAGADTLNGGAGNDTASYATSTARVVANLTNGGSAGDANGDTFSSIENLTGGAGDDLLQGNDGNNILDGGAGNDILVSNHGNDTLIGGAGADQLEGNATTAGTGPDHTTASYITATAGVTVSIRDPSLNTGDAKGDVLGLIDGLAGSNFDDHLIGGVGNNTISGNAGNDILDGGIPDTITGNHFAGNDTLTGGTGNDTFVFHSGLGVQNNDTITDFKQAGDADVIELHDGFTAAQALAGAVQNGADVMITFDATDSIILKNFVLANLRASDFTVVPPTAASSSIGTSAQTNSMLGQLVQAMASHSAGGAISDPMSSAPPPGDPLQNAMAMPMH